ncbi:hypothetical protein VCUG_01653 [Vavraia culicis subsp. floridensis]|uniref:Uncharacterized protein n=1 Tax=Vavraia culicis (isolate floridensis) TaxID=948595 RepID=L2GTE7_VAVCU|nr:uncharacterized protein VCUG_01653 [Vavraia culicis subsp. floridensis]ELA46879.1 hypothetical protein VCUG_01653 [Vavraia culicis subsp. floridensis]
MSKKKATKKANKMVVYNGEEPPSRNKRNTNDKEGIQILVQQDASGTKTINLTMDTDDDSSDNEKSDRGSMECASSCKVNCPNFFAAADTFKDKMATCWLVFSGAVVTVLVFFGFASCIKIYRSVTLNPPSSADAMGYIDGSVPIFGPTGNYRPSHSGLLELEHSPITDSDMCDKDHSPIPIVELPVTPPPRDNHEVIFHPEAESTDLTLKEETTGSDSDLPSVTNTSETAIDMPSPTRCSTILHVPRRDTDASTNQNTVSNGPIIKPIVRRSTQ